MVTRTKARLIIAAVLLGILYVTCLFVFMTPTMALGTIVFTAWVWFMGFIFLEDVDWQELWDNITNFFRIAYGRNTD